MYDGIFIANVGFLNDIHPTVNPADIRHIRQSAGILWAFQELGTVQDCYLLATEDFGHVCLTQVCDVISADINYIKILS